MTLKRNIATEHLASFHEVISELHFLSFFSDAQQKDSFKSAEVKASQLAKVKYIGPATGARLTGIDPFSKSGELRSYGLNMLAARQVRLFAGELHGRLRAAIVCYAFEEAERFFKQLGAILFCQKHLVCNAKDFKKSKFYNGEHKGTPPYYRTYVKWLCRHNCDKLIALMRKTVPSFAEMTETPATRGEIRISPIAGFRIAAYCRHLIVHERGEVAPASLSRFSKEEQKLIGFMKDSTLRGAKDILLPTSNQVELLLERLAALGEIAYRTTSDYCGMKIPPQP